MFLKPFKHRSLRNLNPQEPGLVIIAMLEYILDNLATLKDISVLNRN